MFLYIALRRRNRTPEIERAHGVVYLTWAIAWAIVWWVAISAVVHVCFQFDPASGTPLSVPLGYGIYDPWGIVYPRFDEADPYAIVVGFRELQFSPIGVTVWTKALCTTGTVLLWVVPATIAWTVAALCRRIISGRPFGAELSTFAWWTAGVVLVAGFGGQFLLNLGSYRAALEVSPWLATQIPGEMPPFLQASVDLWPLYAALGIAVVAVLVKYGTRMQKDTELLI